jgi:hypothetical protein
MIGVGMAEGLALFHISFRSLEPRCWRWLALACDCHFCALGFRACLAFYVCFLLTVILSRRKPRRFSPWNPLSLSREERSSPPSPL